jgi:hypothetical protein
MFWTGFETTTTEPQLMRALTIAANGINGEIHADISIGSRWLAMQYHPV